MPRGFDSITPDIHLQKGKQNPNTGSAVSKVIDKALEVSYMLPTGRKPQLRPSSFPKCPIIDWMRLYRHESNGHLEETHSFGNSYFAGVGTVVHEIIQHHIGNTQKVYGNWKCINSDCDHGQAAMDIYNAEGKCVRRGKITATETTNNICPGCSRPMHYVELEISMMGITGHVDCVLVLEDGKWWVVDYKTTLKKKVYNKKLPEKKHLLQLRAYAYILKFQYGLPIAGLSLVYLPRDNPFYYMEHSEDFTSNRDHKRALRILKTEKYKWKAVEKTLKTQDLSHVIEAKPCSCREDYHEKINFYNPCPLLGVCFTDRLPQVLDNYKQAHDSKEFSSLIKFDELVQVISNQNYQTKRKTSKHRSKHRSSVRKKISKV